MKTLIAAAAIAIASTAAHADRLSVLIGSRHIGATGFEETNPGIFYTLERDRLGLSLGVYRNSYGKASVAAFASWDVAAWDGGALAVFGGVAHYPGDGRTMAIHAGDVVPLAGLQIRQGNFFAQLVPMDGKPVKALIAFGLTFDLSK